MQGTFRKSILKVGSYQSPQGAVVVTPQRLKHWESEIQRLQGAGYMIPMHFDHATNPELLEPVAMSALAETKLSRSAAATVGKLQSFRVAPDGQSAEIVVHTMTPSATEKVEANAVFVSPVIYPEWRDGNGQTYTDIITSVDLVDHPVDSKQSTFIPATKLGLVSRPFCLSVVPMDDDKKPEDEKPEAPEAQESGAEADEEKEESKIAYALSDVLAELQKLDVVLPEDTSLDNFIDRLYTALLTAAATGGLNEQAEAAPEMSNPMIATMSLKLQAMENRIIDEARESKRTALEGLLKSGRCTAAEHKKMLAKLGVQKMSLGEDSSVSAGDLDVWIDARNSLPEGAAWTDKQRTQAAQTLSVVEPKSSHNPTNPGSDMSADEINQAASALLRGRGRK